MGTCPATSRSGAKRENARKPKDERTTYIFSGLVHCAECGSKMAAAEMGTGKIPIYRCGRYVNYGPKVCSTHRILEADLERFVLNDIHFYGKLAARDKEKLTRHVLDALETESDQGKAGLNAKIQKMENKADEINRVLASLYRDKALGNLSEAIFQSLLNEYESELKELNSELPELRKEQQAIGSRNNYVSEWADTVQHYLEFDHLDNELARGLIDSIVVSEHKDSEGNTVQDIKISYRFIGNIDAILDKATGVA